MGYERSSFYGVTAFCLPSFRPVLGPCQNRHTEKGQVNYSVRSRRLQGVRSTTSSPEGQKEVMRCSSSIRTILLLLQRQRSHGRPNPGPRGGRLGVRRPTPTVQGPAVVGRS